MVESSPVPVFVLMGTVVVELVGIPVVVVVLVVGTVDKIEPVDTEDVEGIVERTEVVGMMVVDDVKAWFVLQSEIPTEFDTFDVQPLKASTNSSSLGVPQLRSEPSRRDNVIRTDVVERIPGRPPTRNRNGAKWKILGIYIP